MSNGFYSCQLASETCAERHASTPWAALRALRMTCAPDSKRLERMHVVLIIQLAAGGHLWGILLRNGAVCCTEHVGALADSMSACTGDRPTIVPATAADLEIFGSSRELRRIVAARVVLAIELYQ